MSSPILLAWHVPMRQAYTMAPVAPEERPAASGLTAGVLALAQVCAPALSGLTLTLAAPAAFPLAGGLKIACDPGLLLRFRCVPLTGASGQGRRPA